ncbi:MAG: hypothetical protein ABSF23_18575 [Terracidiphilus sp.]|jgi:hypothetical protein
MRVRSGFIILAGLIIPWLASPGALGQGATASFQIQVNGVAILPHIGARYVTMKQIQGNDWQAWGMDEGSAVTEEVVSVPKNFGRKWVEVLAQIENTSTTSGRFQVATPSLIVGGGKKIEAWEYLLAEMSEYDGLVRLLQLSQTPPVGNTVHLKVGGKAYCDFAGQQKTWVIAIFQVPAGQSEGTLVLGDYPGVPVKIPAGKGAD